MPQLSEDGHLAIATVRATDNKDRWLVAVDADTAKARIVDTLHDDAWVRELGGFGPDASFGFPGGPEAPVVHLGAGRLDAPLTPSMRRFPDAPARQLTTGKWEIHGRGAVAGSKRFYRREHRSPPGRAASVRDAGRGGDRTKLTTMTGASAVKCPGRLDDWHRLLVHHQAARNLSDGEQAGAAAQQVTTTPTDEWRSFRWGNRS